MFHYFVVKASGLRATDSVFWGISFSTYYCCVLPCLAPLLLQCSLLAAVLPAPAWLPALLLPHWTAITAAATTAATFLPLCAAFYIDLRAKTFFSGIDCTEKISVARRLLHFLLAPLAQLAHSVVLLYGIWEIALLGKAVCECRSV